MAVSDVAIIGAGLTGLACACHLADRGYRVTVYEKRKNISKNLESNKTSRAMSLDISARGLFALKSIGIEDKVASHSVPMREKIFHRLKKDSISVPYGRNSSEAILAISRTHLYECLLAACYSHPRIEVKFEHNLTKIALAENELYFMGPEQSPKKVAADIVIGADGVNSVAREFLEKLTNTRFLHHSFSQGYKELSIPSHLGLQLKPDAMHVWPRDQFMVVAQPNPDRSYQLAIILAKNSHNPSFAGIKSEQQLEDFFATYFSDLRPLIPNLQEEFFNNPLGDLTLIQGSTWIAQNKLVVMGDAAHAMLPFFGQGVNCCLEDCTYLSHCLDVCNEDWPQALALFDKLRVSNANAISALSYENYPELFPNNNIDKQILKKQLADKLAAQYPYFRPFQELVCFDRVPYISAQKIKWLQEPVLNRLCENVDHIEDINSEAIRQEMLLYQSTLGL